VSVEDFRINAFVRQVLSRSWVDLQALNFGATGRVVYFHGRFQKVRPPSRTNGDDRWDGDRLEEMTQNLALLEVVEKQVRTDPLVRDVVFRLDNFKKIQGKWAPTGA